MGAIEALKRIGRLCGVSRETTARVGGAGRVAGRYRRVRVLCADGPGLQAPHAGPVDGRPDLLTPPERGQTDTQVLSRDSHFGL